MNVSHYGVNSEGGAAIAAQRIIDAIGHDLYDHQVYHFKGESPHTYWNKLPKKKYSLKQKLLRWGISLSKGAISYEPLSHPLMGRYSIQDTSSDVIHFHHIGEAFLNFERMLQEWPKGVPLVWTMHDLNAICALSHYLQNSGKPWSLDEEYKWYSGKIGKFLIDSAYRAKRRFFQEVDVHLVTISDWVDKTARASELGSLANSITKVSYPLPEISHAQQSVIQLPCKKEGQKYICAGAASISNKRKGSEILKEVIRTSPYQWLLFGAGTDFFEGLDNTLLLGHVNQADLAQIYAYSDLFVMTSLEEGFGQTGIEALRGGTPVIGFRNTGAEDFLKKLGDEFLVAERSSSAFQQGIERCLRRDVPTSEVYKELNYTEYAPSISGFRYQELYGKIVKNG